MSNNKPFTFETPQDFADLEAFCLAPGHVDPPQQPLAVWNNPSELDNQYTVWGTLKPVVDPNRLTSWKVLEGAAALVIGYKVGHFLSHHSDNG
jgi:hypothetical protein